MNLTALSIAQIHDLLIRKQVSAEELVFAHLKRIEELDRSVRAYLVLSPERALEQARRIDGLVAANDPLPPLAGVPIAVKDVILTGARAARRSLLTTCRPMTPLP